MSRSSYRLLFAGVQLFDKELKSIAYETKCEECGQNIHATLQELLDQPDCDGYDYKSGSEEGGLTCPNEDCGHKAYLSWMCVKEPHMNDGKAQNHCLQ